MPAVIDREPESVRSASEIRLLHGDQLLHALELMWLDAGGFRLSPKDTPVQDDKPKPDEHHADDLERR